MDTQQSWGDFHFLNTAFNDIVEASLTTGASESWIQTSLVRLSYNNQGSTKDKAVSRTVKAINGLLVEYAIPFPLIYVFPPQAVAVYNETFVLLLQIRRAKGVLERILVRGERVKGEMKAFYAMRGRLSWFIK